MILDNFPDLHESDIAVTPSGVTGPDLWMSGKAQVCLPLLFECKNQEKIQIWAALAQASEHKAKARTTVDCAPAVVFGRNRTEPYIAMKLEDFMVFARATHHFSNLVKQALVKEKDDGNESGNQPSH